MVACIDDNVGRLYDHLEELGLLENTLIFFSSDNGPTIWPVVGTAQPLNGNKFDFMEGGIRMPTFAYWKDTISPGRVAEDPAISMDLLPTFCELAGIELPNKGEIDGVSLAGLLTDGDALPKRTFYFSREGAWAIIKDGRWKYHKQWQTNNTFFRDLQTDPYETTTVVGQDTLRNELRDELDAWIRSNPPINNQNPAVTPAYNPDWWRETHPDMVAEAGKMPAWLSRDTPRGLQVTSTKVSPLPTLSFTLRETSRVTIDLFTVSGRKVARIADRTYAAGTHSVALAGPGGQAPAPGAYMVGVGSGCAHDVAQFVFARK
jgi:hypothetical protein